MPSTLHGAHQETYKAIFKKPAVHNLAWRDVKAMLSALGEVVEEANGSLKVTRNRQSLVLHPHREKEVTEMEDLMQLRHVLERSGTTATPAASGGRHLLVVIDHREARVYETELHGAVPQRVQSFDPHGYGRHLHNVQDEANGQRKPESGPYYDAVIKTLTGAERILIFGTGTGASSAMNQLVTELKTHHKELAGRLAGAIVVDETHLSDDQLLAKAREVYQKSPPA